MVVGQNLGHYKILDKLGAGGMGEVFLAEDATLKRQVALKVLPPELAASRERLDRFQREAETLAALDHPNIVTIYSVEEANGVHFLTMQLVEGERLSDLIPRGGMRLARIFEIAIPLADALAAAHEKGVIHRDLKPGNIMVTKDGRVKVLDFGLAKLRQETAPEMATQLPTEPLTEEGRILGTVPYMSPEQLEGGQIDGRNDIFSLGVAATTSSLWEWSFTSWPPGRGPSRATARCRSSRPS
jgi:serine/threonine-protein kinase